MRAVEVLSQASRQVSTQPARNPGLDRQQPAVVTSRPEPLRLRTLYREGEGQRE